MQTLLGLIAQVIRYSQTTHILTQYVFLLWVANNQNLENFLNPVYSDGSSPRAPRHSETESRTFNFDTVVNFMEMIPYCDLCLKFAECECSKQYNSSDSESDYYSDDSEFSQSSLDATAAIRSLQKSADDNQFQPLLIGSFHDDIDERLTESEVEYIESDETDNDEWILNLTRISSDEEPWSFDDFRTEEVEDIEIQSLEIQARNVFDFVGILEEIENQKKNVMASIANNSFSNHLKSVTNITFDMAETFVLLLWDIKRCETKEDILKACLHVIKHLTKDSLLSNSVTQFCIAEFWNVWNSITVQDSADFVTSISDIIDGYDSFKNSELVERLQETFSFILSFSALNHLNVDPTTNRKRFKDFSGLLRTKPILFGSEFLVSLLKSLRFALTKGKQFWYTGNVEDLILSESKISNWNGRYADLIDSFGCLGNPEPFGINVESFERDLKETIDEGNFFLNNKNLLQPPEISILGRRIAELRQIQREYKLLQLAKSKRPPPFSLLVFGSSGIGKSSFLAMLFSHFAKVSTILGRPLEDDDNFMYTRTVSDKYWSGFSSYQWCILLDDIAMSLPSKAQTDETLDEIVRICNTVPYVPEQASLEGKGTCPVIPKLFLGSTNVKDLNASQWFMVPLAIQRRFQFVVTVVPKPEYALRTDNTSEIMLDPEKARLAAQEGYDDFWIIKVEKVVPGSRIGNLPNRIAGAYELVLETDDMNTFLTWYGNAIKYHYEATSKMIDTMDKYKSAEVCPNCFALCGNQCLIEVQSGNTSGEILERSYLNMFLVFTLFSILFALRFLCKKIYNAKLRYNYSILDGVYTILNNLRIKGENYLLVHASRSITKALKPNKNILIMIGCITTIVTFVSGYFLFKKKISHDAQSRLFPTEKPKEAPVERDNVWTFYEPPTISNADISPVVVSAKGLTINEQIERIAKCCYTLRVFGSDGIIREGRCFALKGQVYVTNAHFFHTSFTHVEVGRTGENDTIGCRRKVKLDPSDIFFDKASDLATFAIKDLPSNRDFSQFLLKEEIETPEMNGAWISRCFNGEIVQNKVRCIIQDKVRVKDDAKGMDTLLSVYKCSGNFVSVAGDCGSLLLGEFGGKVVILGIHVAYDHKNSKIIAKIISKNMMDKFLDCFDNQVLIQSGEPRLDSEKTGTIPVGKVHRKSPLRFVEGDVTIYGSVPFREGGKSRVGKTHLCDQFVEATKNDDLPIVDEMCVPVMKGYVPKQLALSQMVNTSQHTDHAALKICEESYLQDILSALTEEELSLIKPLDLQSNINGVPGIQYIDGIKRGTSAGFPWRECKRKHLSPIYENSVLTDLVDISQEMKDRLDNIEQLYIDGKRYHPVFAATLKDEPVTQEKCKLGKTRVFAAAPLDFSLIVRKFLLPFVRVVQRNKFVFEMGVGAQAQSSEWHQIYEYITKYGKHKIVAGDYSKFDKRMSPSFLLSAFRIVRAVCAKAGYTDEQLRVIDCIAHDISFPTTDFFGDLVMFHGTNPSGHPLTVIINGLVNSLYMRYAYYKINPNAETNTFKDNVSLLTYGDDNIMSVSDNTPWFHHTNIKNALAIIGVQYTMADKETESIPYININDASFLKRSFVYDENLCKIVGPLEHASISKMLTKTVQSRDFVPEQHMLSVIKAALEEYFWYGKEIFENRRNKFYSIARDNNLLQYSENFSAFPTYDELVERYEKASEPFN